MDDALGPAPEVRVPRRERIEVPADARVGQEASSPDRLDMIRARMPLPSSSL
jgi:hypothetical protein